MDKYDRQLRLWSSSGQDLISSSRVLVVGNSLSQCEVLKNLILAGIGHFTLLAENKVITAEDIENNFYLDDEDMGKPLNETLGLRLNELNSDTNRSCIDLIDLNKFIELKKNEFDLIIINGLSGINVDVPILQLETRSFYSLISLKYNEICIIDSHQSIIPDLKLLNSWPELEDYFNSFDLNVDANELSKIPYPVILFKLMNVWMEKYGKLPESRDLKDFKKLIRNLSNEDLLNLEEAIRNSHMICFKKFDFDKINSLNSTTDFKNYRGSYNEKFWLLIYTLKKYLQIYNQLPVNNESPDMDSDTNNYLKLKKIYNAKFQLDLANFQDILKQVLIEFGISSDLEYDLIVKFTKNCRILHHSISSNNTTINSFKKIDSKFKLIAYTFYLLNDLKIPPMLSNYELILSKSRFQTDEFKSVLFEILKSNSIELLNIASITGGVAAQEALKLLMKQYVPLEQIWVFDGINCESEKFNV